MIREGDDDRNRSVSMLTGNRLAFAAIFTVCRCGRWLGYGACCISAAYIAWLTVISSKAIYGK